MATDTKVIKYWVRRIESSNLSVGRFVLKYKVPFGRTKYYEYKRKLLSGSLEIGPVGPKKRGRNQKIGEREETFLRGCLSGGASPSVIELRDRLAKELKISVNQTTILRTVTRLFPEYKLKVGRPKKKSPASTVNPLGGFELIIALAFHLKWPERSERLITEAIGALKKNQIWSNCKVSSDLKGRNSKGHFTKRYNQRADIRINKFASVSDKREGKNWNSMNILRDQALTLLRKNLAVLSLPVITSNGHVRTVNLPRGQALGDLCGFNYKQATLNKFLSELKYLGIAERLLKDLPEFWQQCWGKDVMQKQAPAIYYYIDGNTKGVWSSQHIKQNKVAMLGRVMGCLEQVFIHDGLGHPIYFETYSGHAPVGEYILSMFDKIESTLMEVPGSKPSVCRAIVMDAASNSVKTLRAFANQSKYHFITTLDDNQWSERRVRNPGYPIRYQHGEATLHDIEYELEDSKEKGFLIIVRAIKINWDNGKQTVIITNLPKNRVDANEVVYSYFRRWPAQELIFRGEKSAVSLNRVCGYGRKLVANDRVKIELEKLAIKKQKLEDNLRKPMAVIAAHDKAIAALIPVERRLREQTKIVNGVREIPKKIRAQFADVQQEILAHNNGRKATVHQHAKAFRTHSKTQRRWLRLKSKKEVYQMDVELDQIVTYYRTTLSHLCAYFIKHFLGGEPISLLMFIHRVCHLQAEIKESKNERMIMLQENKKDPRMMTQLKQAIDKFNDLKIKDSCGKVYRFSIN